MPPTTDKKLSCRRCRFRKLKCSRTEPCSKCSSIREKCEYFESDTKRRPAPRSYVSGLEERVTYLESVLVKLKAANDMASVASIFADADIDDHLAKPKAQAGVGIKTETDLTIDSDTTPMGRNYRLSSHLHIEPGTSSLLCHGPTSIFHFPTMLSQTNNATRECCAISNFPGTDHTGQSSHISQVAQHFGINMQEELVNCALEEFFKWQYPYFMFVYREAFLRDHFAIQSKLHAEDQGRNPKYWSAPLLFAVCAIGLLMTKGPSQREAGERFFEAAESLLLVTGIAQPCIRTVQAFLCLAYYEIGRGNLSKGWGFSGMALRMAQDLGFQRDPHKWKLANKSIDCTQEDMEVRRRIYWGCYISDKFFSLIFGRPVFFYDDDAEVELMDRLPDDPSILWLPVGLSEEKGAHSKKSPLIPAFRAQIGLAKAVQHILTKLFTANQNPEGFRRKACIDTLEFELSRWESSLDESLKWNKWNPTSTPLIPNVAALHVLFYSLRIILNLERINMMGTFPVSSSGGSNPKDVCLSSAQDIMAILRKYRSQHGLRYSPLVFIYGAVRAAQVVASFGIPEELSYLLQVLDECSGAWALASNLKEKIRADLVAGPIQPLKA